MVSETFLFPNTSQYATAGTWMTDVPTFSFSMTTGLYDEQSGNLGALLLTSLICMTTTPRLLRLVVPPQQRPLSVAVTFSRYDTWVLSSAPTSVMIPDLGSMLNGPSTSGPPVCMYNIFIICSASCITPLCDWTMPTNWASPYNRVQIPCYLLIHKRKKWAQMKDDQIQNDIYTNLKCKWWIILHTSKTIHNKIQMHAKWIELNTAKIQNEQKYWTKKLCT